VGAGVAAAAGEAAPLTLALKPPATEAAAVLLTEGAGGEEGFAVEEGVAVEPLDGQVVVTGEVVPAASGLFVVAVEGDEEGAGVVVVHGGAAVGVQAVGVVGPAALALDKEADHLDVVEVGLKTGREHAGRSPRCAAPCPARIEQRDGAAGAEQLHATREADQAATDDVDAVAHVAAACLAA